MIALSSADVALVVEDDDVLREVMAQVLHGAGYHVLERASLGDARALLATLRPEVLVLDFNLRGLLGTELLEELSSLDDAPPTLLVSASPLAVEAACRFGITLVKKPFDIDDLVARVRSSIARDSRPSLVA